jgi:hypothetical protein
LGANISGFSPSAPGFVSAAAFLGSLVVYAGALFMFWTTWNFFEGAFYFSPIAIALLFTGKRAISNYAASKI